MIIPLIAQLEEGSLQKKHQICEEYPENSQIPVLNTKNIFMSDALVG